MAVNLSFHALGACFNPYRDLCNLQTKEGCGESINLGSYAIYTSSCKMSGRNAFLTSSYLKDQPKCDANARTSPIVVGFTTGLKVSP